MDEHFPPAEHQALLEPMVAECARSAPVADRAARVAYLCAPVMRINRAPANDPQWLHPFATAPPKAA